MIVDMSGRELDIINGKRDIANCDHSCTRVHNLNIGLQMVKILQEFTPSQRAAVMLGINLEACTVCSVHAGNPDLMQTGCHRELNTGSASHQSGSEHQLSHGDRLYSKINATTSVSRAKTKH